MTARHLSVCRNPIYRVAITEVHSNRINAVTTNHSDWPIAEIDTLRIVRFVVG